MLCYTDCVNETNQQRIAEIEAAMAAPDFWSDKDGAQVIIKEYHDLKDAIEGKGQYDRGGALLTVFAGAGGLDAEDFSLMLIKMYFAYIARKGWDYTIIHQNENEHGGVRNITIEIKGKDVYGTLKHESGVHRLVRVSPFNANEKRHTSFAMVEVMPIFAETELAIPPEELDIQFTRSGGPGGQNVNKRESAVRIVHTPTGLAVHIDTERSQAQNKAYALEILRGKLYHKREEDAKAIARGMSVASTTEAQWGNQIRSYVLHPYKLVKDHRTEVETRNIERVLDDGDLDEFIEAEKSLS